MRKFFKRRAFTIVELLIAVVVTVIIGGGLMKIFQTGIDTTARVDNLSKAVSGIRFSFDSFPEDVLKKASEVQVLNSTRTNHDVKTLLSKLDTDDHLVFLSGDRVCHYYKESATKVIATQLPGSEYISADTLQFVLPVSTVSPDTSPDNYMLLMGLKSIAGADRNKANYAASRSFALYRTPEKSGDKDTTNLVYSGDVLKFKLSSTYEAHIRNNSGTQTIVDASNSNYYLNGVDATYTLKASYNAVGSDANNTPDAGNVKWYISTGYYYASDTHGVGSTYKKDPLIASENSATYDTAGKLAYVWEIVNSDGTAYSSATLKTSGNFTSSGKGFYVKGSDGNVKQWPIRGTNSTLVYYLYCRVTVNASTLWAPWAKTSVTRSSGSQFWSDWFESLNGNTSASGTTYKKSTGSTSIVRDSTNGDYVLLKASATGASGTHIAKVITMNYLYDARCNDARRDADYPDFDYNTSDSSENATALLRRSFTSLTNYSVIIDAELQGTTQLYGLLANGFMGSGYLDYGYLIQFDPGCPGVPIRLITKGVTNDTSVGVETVTKSIGTSLGYDARYHPNYLINNAMTAFGTSYSTSDSAWFARRRFMLTVLEYYTTSGTKTQPHFIFRARILKRYADLSTTQQDAYDSTKDPFMIGPMFFASEPMWFGNFTGGVAKTTAISASYTGFTVIKSAGIGPAITHNYTLNGTGSGKYNGSVLDSASTYYYRQYSSYFGYSGWYNSSGIRVSTASSTDIAQLRTDLGTSIYYPTRWYNSISKFTKGDKYAKFTPQDMDWLNSSAYNNTTWGNGVSAAIQKPDHERIVGLRLHGLSGSTPTAKIYEMRIAPGFSTEELKAIMPQNSKVYEIAETASTSDLTILNAAAASGASDTEKATALATYAFDSTRDTLTGANVAIFGSDGKSDGLGNSGIFTKRFTGEYGVEAIQHTPYCVSKDFTVTSTTDTSDTSNCPICNRR